MIRVDILTLFPELFEPFSKMRIAKRASTAKEMRINVWSLRKYALDKHHVADDHPFGGGPGMLLKPEPLFAGVRDLIKKGKKKAERRAVIYFTPQGAQLKQSTLTKFTAFEQIILICGHYEGIDQRVREQLVTHEISIGPYVISGGEYAAFVFMDALARTLPGVLGNEESLLEESYSLTNQSHQAMLEYPQYTRPADFEGLKVPDVLLSGNHAEIARWRETKLKRPKSR